MSIAVVVKVYDGVVLASDSATSLIGGGGILNVYNHADKIFNLVVGKPIGMIGWGFGGIGGASITTLVKDLRKKLEDKTSELFLGENYTFEDIGKKVEKFFFEDKYNPIYHDATKKPHLGFFIAGYSSNSDAPEVWRFQIIEGKPDYIQLRDQKDSGINWGGETEPINRLIKGVGSGLPKILKELGTPDEQITPAIEAISSKLEQPLVTEAMPIQDAIDLAKFLVTTTIGFVKFNLGAPTVGGPIEIAAITKHEHFKWIKRKHYFNTKLNP